MPAEAEVTDIIVRVLFETGEQAIRLTGTSAMKGFSLLCAGLKLAAENINGREKSGGKINSKKFLRSYETSAIFPISAEDLKKLKPELSRLHIQYMQYKSTKDMKENGIVEISVKRQDTERFIRAAENIGIATVKPYDFKATEVPASQIDDILKGSGAMGAEIKFNDDGVTVNNIANPTQAPIDLLNPSVQSSVNSTTQSDPFEMIFNEKISLKSNLENADIIAKRRSGEYIFISANKDSLLHKEEADSITLTIPGTKKVEHIIIPKDDIVTMNGDNGQSISADLKKDRVYNIVDRDGIIIKKMTGAEVGASRKWSNRYKSQVSSPSIMKGR